MKRRTLSAPTRRSRGVERSALYVPVGDDPATDAPTALAATHGVDVTVTSSPDAALDRLAADEQVDCVVTEWTTATPAGRAFLERVAERHASVPVLAYGEGEPSPALFDVGVVDYVPRDGDTDDCALLARRVEHCASLVDERASARWFRTAVEQAGHVIMITDTDGTIEYVNPAFEVVTGYDASEALGRRPSFLKSGEHDDEFYRDLWQTVLSGEVWEGELVNRRKDGSRYTIEQTIAPVTDDDGTVRRFVAVNADVTAARRRQRKLRRERDRLDEFAGTIAHDLRNPLSIALGNVELASDSDDPGHLETAADSLERIDSLVDELLTLSKQGETVRDPESVELADAVREAWGYVSTETGELDVADDLADVRLSADESRLLELLENLFRNAVEHAGDGVTVTVGPLADRRGFYVADDGPGIPPDAQGRVFDSGVSSAPDGTGYGLAIVRQIVNAHGWAVSVTDAAGGGARFEVAVDGS